MGLSRGYSLQSMIGSRHAVNITYPALDETLQGTPTVLPASEPGSPQINYTVSAVTHLPVVDAPITYSYAGMLNVSGKNLTGSSQTLSYRILKNSVSLTTGTLAATASIYWTVYLAHTSLIGLVEGDVVSVSLWTTGTNLLNWDYNYFAAFVTRIKLFNDSRKIAFNVTYSTTTEFYPVPALGAPYKNQGAASRVYGANKTTPGTASVLDVNGATNQIPAQFEDTTMGIYAVTYGDSSTTPSIVNHASRHPYYWCNQKISKIAWNEINLRI